MARLMNEIVGKMGAYQFLDRIYEYQDVVQSQDLAQLIDETNISQDLFSELTDAGLFIGTPDGFYISSLGKRVTLLLRGINGEEELSGIFRKLSYLYPELRPYELITEDITSYFVDSLLVRPDFIRVYICSPWIRLEQSHLEKVKQAVLQAKRRYENLQILVITKPRRGYRNWQASVETFEVLRSLGAEIVTNEKLHAKLYISEPGSYGGAQYAIFGSENLTGRQNIELAIKIENDNEILGKLTHFFFEIREESKILEEV